MKFHCLVISLAALGSVAVASPAVAEPLPLPTMRPDAKLDAWPTSR